MTILNEVIIELEVQSALIEDRPPSSHFIASRANHESLNECDES